MLKWTKGEKLRILDFDIENRPLSYWVPDRPSAEITAIAWSWVAEDEPVHVALLGDMPLDEVLGRFVGFYDRADMVTGHYIRKHDLPIINGALIEQGMDQLEPKLTSDTRLDLPKLKDLPVSQESLGEILRLEFDKHHMSQPDWREANRLTAEGRGRTRERVVSDVQQHKAMRKRLLELDLLGPPREWRP